MMGENPRMWSICLSWFNGQLSQFLYPKATKLKSHHLFSRGTDIYQAFTLRSSSELGETGDVGSDSTDQGIGAPFTRDPPAKPQWLSCS